MAKGVNAQTMPAQEAGRPQPQTTVEASGGPFIRHSQQGRAPIYNVTGTALSGIVTQPLVARPGYFRNFRVTTSVSGGAMTGTTGLQIDAPFNTYSLVQLKDAFGTPLVVAPGFEATQLIPLYGGAFGVQNGTNFAQNLPSYTAYNNAGSAGSFSWSLPLEMVRGYGVLSAANASLLPTLQFNVNSASAIWAGTPAGTFPTVSTQVDTDFYWLPEGVSVEPPGLGTTRQWMLQQANPQVAANSSTRVQFPRLGGYLDTIIMEMRDSTGARTDGFWPNRLQLYVDGVPLIDSTMNELYDDMAIAYGFGAGVNAPTTPAGAYAGTTGRPVGTVAVNRKTSLSQTSLGLLDSGETVLSTNPGTLLEANLAPAGAGSNGPATMSVLIGQIVPTGALIQGLPEV